MKNGDFPLQNVSSPEGNGILWDQLITGTVGGIRSWLLASLADSVSCRCSASDHGFLEVTVSFFRMSS